MILCINFRKNINSMTFRHLLAVLVIYCTSSSVSLRLHMCSSTVKSAVICGDSTQIETYKKLGLGPSLQRADALITDPPYCLLQRRRKGGDLRDPKKRTRKLDDVPTVSRFENLKEYRLFTKEWLQHAIPSLKETAPLVIWTNVLGKKPIIDACVDDYKYIYVGEYLWAKRTTLTANQNSTKNEMLLRVYESALIFKRYFNEADRLKLIESNIPWSCITGYHDDEHERSSAHPHPNHKPFAALEPLLRAWTSPGDIVLDCFSGSGGVLSAVKKIGGGRTLKGIEILPDWVSYTNKL